MYKRGCNSDCVSANLTTPLFVPTKLPIKESFLGFFFILQKGMRALEKFYTDFKCGNCGKETILISGEVSSTLKYGNYLVCSHCSSKKLIKINETDSFKECMSHSAYKREHGSLKQIR